MAPSKADVHAMVAALFTLTAGMERARRQRKAAGTLSLLQLVADRQPIRPSEIAEVQDVHPSLVTRQVRELEDAGHVQVAADPADGRSCLVTLTPAGPASCSGSPRPAWTGLPCSWRTGRPATSGCSPHCWTSSGTPSPPSLSRSRSNAQPAVAGHAPPDSISGTGCLAPQTAVSVSGRTKPGATEPLFGCGASRHENRPGLAPYRVLFAVAVKWLAEFSLKPASTVEACLRWCRVVWWCQVRE